MINVLKKKKCVIYAPANGKVVDLSKVPDPVFSKKMMGEGVGLIFEGDILFDTNICILNTGLADVPKVEMIIFL